MGQAEEEQSASLLSEDVSVRHTRAEDAFALIEAAVLFAIGVMFLKACGQVTGSLSGLSLLISYWSGYPFGWIFVAINLPFLLFGFVVLGRAFALKTLILCLAIPALTLIPPGLLHIDHVHPVVGAIGGALLIGNAILIAARHSASAGGVGVMAIWLQKTGRMKAGTFQLGVDLVVLSLSVFLLPPDRFLWSAAGIVLMNSVMIVWHQPQRYIGY
ncbi:MAG: YitT family protein [Sphingomonadaceae bacterium]|jgi:uncharacterized membrane-anchored protein YitT (DUF2179 family)